tara:strand:- start:11081 stop:12331 length:1251 start_codon:yes stop_codon:yes gene_type:complete
MNLPNWLLRIAGWATPKRRRRKSLVQSAERFEPKAMLSAFIVDSPLDQPDANPGDGIAATASGKTTLRAAIQEANAAPGTDTILLPPGLLELSLQGSTDHSAASGDLEITDDVVISGGGRDETFIDASQIDSAFHIQDGVSLTLEQLTLLVAEDSGTGIVNDGGSLTLDDADIDEAPPAFPARDYSDLTTNSRHADLLVGLYQPVVERDEPLDPIFAPPPIFVSITNATKPDATIAIGTERTPGWSTADGNLDLQPTPRSVPAEQLENPVRVADQNSETPGKKTQQRRRDVVNSLFQDHPDSNPQAVKPVAGEQPAESNSATEAEPRRLREAFPMLLPMNEDGSLEVVPEDSTVDGPLPPPLPEPAQFKEAADNTRRAAGQSAPGQALMAGVLLTMVRPGVIRRAVRRLTDWKNVI